MRLTDRTIETPRWTPPDEALYAHLLGLYLGDGCLVQGSARSWRLELYLDRIYPDVISEAASAMSATAGGAKVNRQKRPGAVRLVTSSAIWPEAFPQHGPGKKHDRRIELADWQRQITHAHPEALLRGLIHADGCRTLNRFDTRLPSGRVAHYEYTRYFFTNSSADIRAIFCEHCERMEIRWSRSNARNISISDRDSVARLDSFVGPKR